MPSREATQDGGRAAPAAAAGAEPGGAGAISIGNEAHEVERGTGELSFLMGSWAACSRGRRDRTAIRGADVVAVVVVRTKVVLGAKSRPAPPAEIWVLASVGVYMGKTADLASSR